MAERQAEKPNILVTGTKGRVGNAIIPGLSRLFTVTQFDIALCNYNDGRQIRGDVAEPGAFNAAVSQVEPDCIVHLAANADQEARFKEVYRPNYLGTQAVYEAALRFEVPRIIFASSLHTLSGYPGFPDRTPFADGRKFSPNDPPNPGNAYGKSKVWGEWLGQLYSKTVGIQTIALRIGDLNANNQPAGEPYAHFAPIWLSHPDALQGFAQAITAETPNPSGVYFLTSDNNGPYDIQPTIDDLGYVPVDGIAK
jgi:NAD+ dependent glucose-6-phosphate dehydrogenase